MEQSEIYTEKIMNMVMDVIDDIIIIYDSAHTIIWMNRAGEKAFGKSVDGVIGMKCYELFGNTISCSDCVANVTNIGSPANNIKRRIIPGTEVECDCSAVSYFKNGKLELVVQHLRPVYPDVVYPQRFLLRARLETILTDPRRLLFYTTGG